MSENQFWTNAKTALRGLDPQRIEGARAGTPDVNYADGWIELKQVDSWPAREDTPLRIAHYTPEQRTWHLRRSLAGGRIWVLLQVDRTVILLEGRVASEILGKVTRTELLAAATRYWEGPEWKEELKNELHKQ